MNEKHEIPAELPGTATEVADRIILDPLRLRVRIAELEAKLAQVRGVIEAHDVRLESCDRDGICDCLEWVLRGKETAQEIKGALEAADIPALLAERDGLRFVHGELSEVTMEAQAEVRELRARVAELEASHRRLLIFASDLYDIAANGYLDDELLAMRGVKALTAKTSSKEEVEEAYSWLEDVAANERGEGEVNENQDNEQT